MGHNFDILLEHYLFKPEKEKENVWTRDITPLHYRIEYNKNETYSLRVSVNKIDSLVDDTLTLNKLVILVQNLFDEKYNGYIRKIKINNLLKL